MRTMRGFTVAVATLPILALAGCVETGERGELQRVLGVIPPSGVVNVVWNPELTVVGDRTLRVQVWTVSECEMARPETFSVVRDEVAVVTLWELRGPCLGSFDLIPGKHDVEVTWGDDVEAPVLIIQSDYAGLPIERRLELELVDGVLRADSPVHPDGDPAVIPRDAGAADRAGADGRFGKIGGGG